VLPVRIGLPLTILLIVTELACGQETNSQTEEGSGRIIRVGSEHSVKTIAAAARLARDGDTVEIQAGDYAGDTAVWTQNNLRIRGIGGRPRLIAAGQAAERKAIWVVRGGEIVIEDIAFTGARVPDRNGAGIRLERGKLTVRRCLFTDNENGMLVGNEPSIILDIADSEFAENGSGDGYSHNLYVGAIRRLTVVGSYFHHARGGHLLKTRAQENIIRYNRLTDESAGRASYELEFPSGGLAVVVGNLIQQSEHTENSVVISFGAEGYKWARNELYLSYNTIVNDRAEGGIFTRVHAGLASVNVADNIFVGRGDLDIKTKADLGKNWWIDRAEFMSSNTFDFRLKPESRAAAGDAQPSTDVSLKPTHEYTYPVGTEPVSVNEPLRPGAFQ